MLCKIDMGHMWGTCCTVKKRREMLPKTSWTWSESCSCVPYVYVTLSNCMQNQNTQDRSYTQFHIDAVHALVCAQFVSVAMANTKRRGNGCRFKKGNTQRAEDVTRDWMDMKTA